MTGKTPNDAVSGDDFPSHDELDALQAQIDAALKESADKAPKPAAPSSGDEALGDEALLDEGAQYRLRIAELEAEIAAMKDRALRAMADAENVKKRAERETASARIYGIERFAVDILSVHDNLSRALGGLDAQTRAEFGAGAQNVLAGLELTEKDLIAVLSRHGIRPVPGKGSKFDPNLHQAVAQIPSQESKGDIAEVMQTGFTLGDRTLRAAMVAVSTGKAGG